MMLTGQVGKYKIVYIKSKADLAFSRMFDTVDSALSFAHKLKYRWVLMQKVAMEDRDYAWKMLPYGAYRSYRAGVVMDSFRYLIIGAVLFVVFYYLMKFFSKKTSVSIPSPSPAGMPI